MCVCGDECVLTAGKTCEWGFAEEAGTGNELLLTKPNESLEKRQRRIKQLVEDMPATLKLAEEAEAVLAAAAKASQTELPSPEKVLLTLTIAFVHTSCLGVGISPCAYPVCLSLS